MNLIDHTDHRPYPPPDEPWVMHQAWNDFLFMHWQVDPEVLRKLVPEPLELHLADGMGWLGIIPFHMTDVRPRGTINVPGISAFPELNVRTYVRHNGIPGVYFLSLDADHRLAVETARLTYGLPYLKADMHWERRDGTIHYRSRRVDGRAPKASLEGVYGPKGDYFYAKPNSLAKWLSERYCLFTVDGQSRVHIAHVHHLPWPMRQADCEFPTNSMAEALGIHLSSKSPDFVRYSPGVDVVVWRSIRITGQ